MITGDGMFGTNGVGLGVGVGVGLGCSVGVGVGVGVTSCANEIDDIKTSVSSSFFIMRIL